MQINVCNDRKTHLEHCAESSEANCAHLSLNTRSSALRNYPRIVPNESFTERLILCVFQDKVTLVAVITTSPLPTLYQIFEFLCFMLVSKVKHSVKGFSGSCFPFLGTVFLFTMGLVLTFLRAVSLTCQLVLQRQFSLYSPKCSLNIFMNT